jgi:hypothetical protein
MAVDFERQHQAAELIPKGSTPAQAKFRRATCLAYARGLPIQDAIDFGTEQARKDDSDFVPRYDIALLTISPR